VALTEIYKPGQGKYVRVGTLIGLGILMGFGMFWLGKHMLVAPLVTNGLVKAAIIVAFGGLWALLGLYIVNKPKYAEFMIMTESEMRKVHWPSKQVVINSTKVVIFLTLVLAVILFAVDLGFAKFFEVIGILRSSGGK
jgi:preprotein translocase subunit SecE